MHYSLILSNISTNNNTNYHELRKYNSIYFHYKTWANTEECFRDECFISIWNTSSVLLREERLLLQINEKRKSTKSIKRAQCFPGSQCYSVDMPNLAFPRRCSSRRHVLRIRGDPARHRRRECEQRPHVINILHENENTYMYVHIIIPLGNTQK